MKKTNLVSRIGIAAAMITAFFLVTGCNKGGGTTAGQTGEARTAVDFPRRPIEMVIPFGSGSASDVFARQYAQITEKYLGKPISCVNKSGAGTIEGMTYAYNAPADGYTILEITPSLLIKELMNESNIKFRASFEPLIKVQNDLQLFGVSKNSPHKTLEDLIAYAKANPGKLKIGGVSPGGLDDYIANGFARAAGFTWTYVPYKSGSEVKAAVLGGELDIYQDKMINFLPMAQSGDIIPLVVLSDKSYPDIPGLEKCPASAERGINFTQGSWRGFVIKKGVPQEIKDILINALTEAYGDTAYKEMEEREMTNLSPGFMKAADWTKDWDREYNNLEEVFKLLGLI
ncbi:MAG: tripartite tricarboxylate transporter substrate binding protein [Treponema sp.]|jgi:tripartite-type tricarboxylate transporter receptor subunit TctC|nr:tripartite tricarboxylate transporter substrate binding protein [Treponema sp.]